MLYEAARTHMSETAFETYLFTAREKRWKTQNELEKLEHDISYRLSEANPACFGKYTKPLTHPIKPQDASNCKRGIQELSHFEAELKSKMTMRASLTPKELNASHGLQSKSNTVKT